MEQCNTDIYNRKFQNFQEIPKCPYSFQYLQKQPNIGEEKQLSAE